MSGHSVEDNTLNYQPMVVKTLPASLAIRMCLQTKVPYPYDLIIGECSYSVHVIYKQNVNVANHIVPAPLKIKVSLC